MSSYTSAMASFLVMGGSTSVREGVEDVCGGVEGVEWDIGCGGCGGCVWRVCVEGVEWDIGCGGWVWSGI